MSRGIELDSHQLSRGRKQMKDGVLMILLGKADNPKCQALNPLLYLIIPK